MEKMTEAKRQNKTREYVYDISLDGTVVNALGLNVLSNTDGFNFQMPKEFRYTKEHPYIGKGNNRLVVKGKEYYDEWGDIMEFNDLFMRYKMGLDEDEVIPANITCARKNYLDLLDNGEIKMVGNTLKSKKMPLYIEKFITKAADLLLHKKGREFIEFYYDYVEKIYNMQIPLKEIASVGKIKITIDEYLKNCQQLTSAGNKKSRQAWYELAIKENLKVNIGDAVYYINTGKKPKESDVKRVTKYFYYNHKHEKIYNVLDEKGKEVLDRKGNPISLTKEIEKEYKKKTDEEKKNNTLSNAKESKLDFAKKLYPKYNIEEEDVILFSCVLVPNNLIEDTEEHFCDEDFEYNRTKYIEQFNNRIKPLLVVFDKKIRETVNKKGEIVNNILITNPKDRKSFTEEECTLICGQPYQETDQDTYEQLMTMDDKEIEFWLSINKKPTYIDNIESMDWETIKKDYFERQEKVKQEIEEYCNIIDKITETDVSNFLNNGTIPTKLDEIVKLVKGNFISKKTDVKIGTIYDIIDKDFEKEETEEE